MYNLMVQNLVLQFIMQISPYALKKVKLKYTCSGKNFGFTGSF